MKIWENILIGEKTHVGHVRENNKDNWLVVDQTDVSPEALEQFGILVAVADGMGGCAAGETASETACERLREFFFEQNGGHSKKPVFETVEEIAEGLKHIFYITHDAILRLADQNPDYEGMGTTLSALMIHGEKAVVAHVGDSRIYRLRDNGLTQLTVDHTQVQSLIEMGRLNPEQARNHPGKHLLTQAMGVEDGIEEIYTRIEDISPDDIYLLCSDGLYDMIDDTSIQKTLAEEPIPQRACERLVSLALGAGGRDNVTVLVVRLA